MVLGQKQIECLALKTSTRQWCNLIMKYMSWEIKWCLKYLQNSHDSLYNGLEFVISVLTSWKRSNPDVFWNELSPWNVWMREISEWWNYFQIFGNKISSILLWKKYYEWIHNLLQLQWQGAHLVKIADDNVRLLEN